MVEYFGGSLKTGKPFLPIPHGPMETIVTPSDPTNAPGFLEGRKAHPG